MQAEEIARLLGTRFGSRNKARAKCPVHKSRGLTLALKAGSERVSITCHAGCHSDDVLATLGLTWRDTLYRDTNLTPEQRKEWAKHKREQEEWERWVRTQEMTMMLNAVNLKPYQRCKRSRSTFDILVEKAYQ